MTSSDIRQSFLDFFKSKQHTIVPSSSLLPDSPNLLFTNAGMNQFVPIFLGQVACPYNPPRAADTQKCIRAGGKHNDLDDVGLDTYHHTFFEMLGNWSFGDYFKREAIDWAWELITEVWKFPKNRIYATVYSPDKSKGDPSEFDQEAYDFWAAKFTAAGLDPKVHIVYGNKKDNFWMMGETGPCGPCSELHVDLTPDGDTKGALVNKGDARCIEIWNLVFIQFNANPDGTFSPLPARHVDTGMGFERVSGIIQCTKNFTDFTGIISNYETDIFRPIFDQLEKMSGKKYCSTLPGQSAVAPATLRGEHTRPRVSLTAPSQSANKPSETSGSKTSPTAAPLLSGEHTRPRVSLTAPSQSANKTSGTTDAKYSRRNLPHFERPWAKYMVTFSTVARRELTPAERDIAMQSILYAHEHRQYQLYAACVMPDHAHLLFEPQIKEQDAEGNPVFWSLSDILQGIKSASAHRINAASKTNGPVWEKESMDRMIRGQTDMEEKFHYICRNPWDGGIASVEENYPWLWVPDGSGWAGGNVDAPVPTAGAQSATREGACAPGEAAAPLPDQEKIDVAFRVIADHIRTLSFSIADGIQPGNTDRKYVLRRILRRAVRYGRTLGFHEPFFYKLVDVLADGMGDVFQEVRTRKKYIQDVIRTEEEAFNKTLDTGIELFEELVYAHEAYKQVAEEIEQHMPAFENAMALVRHGEPLEDALRSISKEEANAIAYAALPISKLKVEGLPWEFRELRTAPENIEDILLSLARGGVTSQELGRAKSEIGGLGSAVSNILCMRNKFCAQSAFVLYDTYGFPLDLTELMARERGMTVDKAGFDALMDKQKALSRAAQKKSVISISEIGSVQTQFVGFDTLEADCHVLHTAKGDGLIAVVDVSPFYAEMGGQVGDAGIVTFERDQSRYRVLNTIKRGQAFILQLESTDAEPWLPIDEAPKAHLQVDKPRRNAIQRHHTVTHLLHWALHEVASKEASQKGSFVGPDKLTFDFNSAPLTPQQIVDVEKLVNERIVENAVVSWTELPYADVKARKDVMQFFGDKYGDKVRVVQIGGGAGELNGYSMELCGGTHTRATGEIGLFRIVSETATGAGIRRIEAVAGLRAYERSVKETEQIEALAKKLNTPVVDLEKKIDGLLAQQKELEKNLKAAQQKQAAGTAKDLVARATTINGVPTIIENLGATDGDTLQSIADSLKGQFKGVIVLGGVSNGAVSLLAAVSAEFTAKFQAGKIIQTIAPIVGGKGGGKPDNARGGGKETGKLDEALGKARSLLGGGQ